MKVAIGIPTFNRSHIVEMHARSLSASRLASDTIVIVIDDASTEYDTDFLKSIFPSHSDIRRRAKHSGGADLAIRDLMEQLFATDADALMLLDSDMLVTENFLEVGISLLQESDGIISLFNTPTHPSIGSRGPFVLKRTIGSAGSLWRRDVAEKTLAGVPPGKGWDWRFCEFLVDAGYKICVARYSLVQHAGFAIGENSSFENGDYGTGFLDNSSLNGYALVEQAISFARTGFRQFNAKIVALQNELNDKSVILNTFRDDILTQKALEAEDALTQKALEAEFEQTLSYLLGAVREIEIELRVRSDKAGQQAAKYDDLRNSFLEFESQARYIFKRSLLEKLFFRIDGRPVKPLRRTLFHNSGAPRKMFHRFVFHRNGKPRRAFSRWLTSESRADSTLEQRGVEKLPLISEGIASDAQFEKLGERNNRAFSEQFFRKVGGKRFLYKIGLPSRNTPPSETLRSATVLATPREHPKSAWGLALIATRNYLPYAKVAISSFLAHHPEFQVYVLVVDGETKDFELFQVEHFVSIVDLNIEHISWFAAKFTANELSNVLKPSFMLYLSDFVERVIYLDVDVFVFSRMQELIDLTTAHPLAVIPHMFDLLPQPDRYDLHPTRGDIFCSGLINAGCFGINISESLDFLRFWQEGNFAPGTFYHQAGYQTDQQYFNWAFIRVPSTALLRERRYNVAYWNLHERNLRLSKRSDGTSMFVVDDKPLAFFHFSGFNIQDPLRISRYDYRNSVYNLPAVADLLSMYRDAVRNSAAAPLLSQAYRFDELPNGLRLNLFIREILKKYESHMPKYDSSTEEGANALCAFLMDPLPITGSLLPLILAEIYDQRPDLQSLLPGAHTAISPSELWRWFLCYAGEEYGVQILVHRFRRCLVSDSIWAIARQAVAFLRTDSLRLLGDQRLVAAQLLRQSGQPEIADELRDGKAEWFYFTELSAGLTIYRHRQDLQKRFPDILGSDHEAFCDWLTASAPLEHDCPAGTGERLRRHHSDASLARIYSFLARREDVASHCQESLLSDNPDVVLRDLIRVVGDGTELDLDDVVVFQHIHKMSRHLLVPLYLELPLVRWRRQASRVAGNNIDSLPESVRHMEWAIRGADVHATYFNRFDAYLDEEARRFYPESAPRTHDVLEFLRNPRTPVYEEPRIEPAFYAAIQRLLPSEAASLGLKMRLMQRVRRPAVNVFGYFAADIGVGESSRALAQTISLLRPVNRVPMWTGSVRDETRLSDLFQRFDFLSDTNVFVTYPHQREDLLGTFRPEWIAGRRNVAYLAWEQKDVNPLWKAVYDRYDEVWAISEFAATGFREMLSGRVRVVPNVLDFDGFPEVDSSGRMQRDTVNFLFVFDANSSIERKNPEAVIDAFVKAFRDTKHADRVTLTLKVGSMDRSEHAPRIEELTRRAAASGLAIKFDGRQISRDEILRMIGEADCYVSLHRSEGFGYTMAEAMYYGVPVIASCYSGNLEYMTPENSFLVPCSEVLVKAPDGPFQRGSVWGEPDIDVAAELMRKAVEDRALFLQVGERGRGAVINKLSAEAVSKHISSYFNEAKWSLKPEHAEAL